MSTTMFIVKFIVLPLSIIVYVWLILRSLERIRNEKLDDKAQHKIVWVIRLAVAGLIVNSLWLGIILSENGIASL